MPAGQIDTKLIDDTLKALGGYMTVLHQAADKATDAASALAIHDEATLVNGVMGLLMKMKFAADDQDLMNQTAVFKQAAAKLDDFKQKIDGCVKDVAIAAQALGALVQIATLAGEFI
jgi:glutamine synthetase type III